MPGADPHDSGILWPRLSEVRELRFWELNESGEIAMGTGIILPKRKGGISLHFI
jgi:hypothetical protein